MKTPRVVAGDWTCALCGTCISCLASVAEISHINIASAFA